MIEKELFPAVLLANNENAQDTRVILKDNSTSSASELLRASGPLPHLRFMVQSNEPKTSNDPRITWQVRPNGGFIVSAAFAAGVDSHKRVASAALIYELDGTENFLREIPAALNVEHLTALKKVLKMRNSALYAHVVAQKRLGLKGGEYRTTNSGPRVPDAGEMGLRVPDSRGVLVEIWAAVISLIRRILRIFK